MLVKIVTGEQHTSDGKKYTARTLSQGSVFEASCGKFLYREAIPGING